MEDDYQLIKWAANLLDKCHEQLGQEFEAMVHEWFIEYWKLQQGNKEINKNGFGEGDVV